MEELKLGKRISFKTIYRRHDKKIPTKWGTFGHNRFKYWKKIDVKKQKGIVVGLRTLSNGSTSYDSEEGYTYTRKESVYVVLVSTTLRNEILKIPLEDIILKE